MDILLEGTDFKEVVLTHYRLALFELYIRIFHRLFDPLYDCSLFLYVRYIASVHFLNIIFLAPFVRVCELLRRSRLLSF